MIANEITEKELLAVRFYMGDPAVADSGAFRGGREAYNTINALMHPGTANEKDKALEGRVVMLEDAAHLKEYLDVILDVYMVMVKYRMTHQWPSCTYRIDRASSLIRFEQNHHLVSGFFSTCKWGYLGRYAAKKANIVLMEVLWDETVPFIDFEGMFGDGYVKPEEAEILLPFGVRIAQMDVLELTEEEMADLRDINDQPPRGKWRLHLTMPELPEIPADTLEELYAAITDEEAVQLAAACMAKLSGRQSLSLSEEQSYCSWKSDLQQFVAGALRQRYANELS